MAQSDKPEDKPQAKDETQASQPDWLKSVSDAGGDKSRSAADSDKSKPASDNKSTAGDGKSGDGNGKDGASRELDLLLNKVSRDNAARIKAAGENAVPLLVLSGLDEGQAAGKAGKSGESAKKNDSAPVNDAAKERASEPAAPRQILKGQHPQFGESVQTIDPATGKVETSFKDPKSPFESISYSPGPPAKCEAQFRPELSPEARKEMQAKLDRNEIAVSQTADGRGKLRPDGVTELSPADPESAFRTVALRIDKNGHLTVDAQRSELSDKAAGKDRDALVKDLNEGKLPLDTVKSQNGEQRIYLGGRVETVEKPERQVEPAKESGVAKDGSHLSKNADGSCLLINKAGEVEQASTASGVKLSVRREVDPAKPDAAGRVVEAQIGNQVWTRSKEAGKENVWTSNNNKQRTGEFVLDKDGSMHFKDAVGKGELVHKLDGSVVEKDPAGHVRRMTTTDGRSYSYSYDSAGKMNAIRMPDGTSQTRLPDRLDADKKPVERWIQDGTNKITDGSRSVDSDGTLHLKNAGEKERIIRSNGFEESQGANGEKLFSRENADRSTVTKNTLGQTVETKTADGQVRKFAYDQSGHMTGVDLGKEGKWTSADGGKNWSKEGATPPETKKAGFLITPQGDLVEHQKVEGKNQELIRKTDGSVLHAENGRYTSARNAAGQEYKVGYSEKGQPVRFEEPGAGGAYWTSSDNKTWTKHNADGKPDASAAPQKFSVAFDPHGNLLKRNTEAGTLERKGTDGSSTTATPDGRKLSEVKPDGTGKFVETKYQYDAANRLAGKEVKNADGTVEKSDAQGRLTEVAKGQFKRTFAYEDANYPSLVTSFTDNGNKYALDKQALAKDQVVYRNSDPAKSADVRSGLFSVGKDGSMVLRSENFELNDRIEGGKTVRREDGSILEYGADGRLASTRDVNGRLTTFKYNLSSDVLGRPGQLSEVTYGEGASATTWRTSDGFAWKQDGTGKEWKGFTSVNQQDGTITDKHYYGSVSERRLDGQVVQRPDLSVNIASATGEIHKTIGYWYNSNAIVDIRNQMHGKTAEEIQMMKAVYADQNNGTQMWDDLYKRFDKGGDTHRWAEVEGYLNKKGKAGEDSAIQLAVDSQEIHRWWWNRDRSKSEILASTRNVLGNATEAERKNYADAYSSLYNKDFQSLYRDGGAGNTIRTWDKYHETLLGTALEKGKDLRTAKEEAAILSSALQSGNHLDYFMEAAGGIVKQSGREEFLANGGRQQIRDVFTQTQVTEGGSYEMTDEWRVQQATDFAETGALRPHTAIRKAGGVFSNDDKVIEHTLDKLTPEQRSQFTDGQRISTLPEQERQNLSGKEKESYEFYNKMMDSFKSLHYFGADKKAEKYIDQSLHQGGTDVTYKVAPIGGHWTNSNQVNAQAIESMDQRTFNALMSGTRGHVDGQGKIEGAVAGEGGKQYLSAFHEQMSRAMSKNLGGGQYIERAQKLLDDKIKAGVAVNDAADSGNLTALRQKVPALGNIPEEKFNELAAGHELQKKIASGEIKETALKGGEAKQLEAYRKDTVLRPFMEGRDVARQLNDIESGARAERLFAGRELAEQAAASGRAPTVDQQRQIDFYKQNAGEIEGLTRNLTAQVVDRQRESFNKQLSTNASESLQSYQKTLYDTVQGSTNRDILQTLKDNESFWGNDRKAMLEGVLSMNAATREKIKNDPQGYGQELRAQLQEKFAHGSKDNAEYRLMDSLLKQIESSDKKLPDAPAMGVKEQLLARKAGLEGWRDKDAVGIVTDVLKTDTDGSVAKKLAGDAEFKAAAVEALHGNAALYDSQIKPLLESGRLPTDTLKERHTHIESSGEGDPGHPVFDARGFFKEGVLEASPKALKLLNSPEGAAEREKLLAELKSDPKLLKMAEEIIKQGEVRDEDRVRAFVTGSGAFSKDQALELMRGMPEGKRMEMEKAYEDKYGENFRAGVLSQVGNKEFNEFFRATRSHDWTTEQSYLHAVKTVSSTDAGVGAAIARSYNVTHLEALNKFSQEKYDAAVNNRPLDAQTQEKMDRLVEETVKSFKETKESTNDTIVTGTITAGSIALAPFTGGTSLYGLVGISAAMGASGAGLKYALSGNDTEGVKQFAGDTFKFTAMAFSYQLSAGHLTRAFGLGENAANAAASTALTKAGLDTASAEVKDQVRNGMLTLIRDGIENGGVANKAVSEMVQGVKGLSDASKVALARELQSALPNAVRAEMEGAARQVLQTIRMRAQATAVQSTVGGIGGVIGEGGRQIIDDGKLDADGLKNSFVQCAIFAGTFSNVIYSAGTLGRSVLGRTQAPHAGSSIVETEAVLASKAHPATPGLRAHAPSEAPSLHGSRPAKVAGVADDMHLASGRTKPADATHTASKGHSTPALSERGGSKPQITEKPAVTRISDLPRINAPAGEQLARSTQPHAPYTAGDYKLNMGGRDMPLDQKVVLLGRDPGRSDLVFKEGTVSGRHAQIEFKSDGPVIKDLGSTNGTTINGRVIKPGEEVRLHPGDKIKLGPEREFIFGVKPEFHFEVNGQAVDLSPGGMKIGRLNDNNLVIADNAVSRHHASIVNTEKGPVITDMGSTNGTYVNGKQIRPNEPVLLKPGDSVQFGKDGQVYKLGKGMETPVELKLKAPEAPRQVMEYKPRPESNPAASPDAVRESNAYKAKGEIREPLRDGYQTLSGDARISADGTWNDPHRPGVVVDRAQDRVLNDAIATAHKRFDHLKGKPEELAKELTSYSKELMHPKGWSEEMVDASYNTFRNENRGRRILLGDYIDRASRGEGAGVCQHQALLMKVLGDDFGLDVSLVSGFYGKAPAGGLPKDTFANHAWNEVHMKGKTYIYDPRHEQFGKTAAELPRHNPSRSWLAGPDAAPVGRFENVDLKAGDIVSHDGVPRWQVTTEKPQTPGNVVITAPATRASAADEIAQLNPEHQKLVIGEKYRLRRSNGAVEEGWQLRGQRQDGTLEFYKADGFKQEVSLKELARENPNIGEIRAAREPLMSESARAAYGQRLNDLKVAPEKQAELMGRLEQVDPSIRARLIDSQPNIRNAGQLESMVRQAEVGQQLLDAGVRVDQLSDQAFKNLTVAAAVKPGADTVGRDLLVSQLKELSAAGRLSEAEALLQTSNNKIKSVLEAVAAAPEAERSAMISRLMQNPEGHIKNYGKAYSELLDSPEVRESAKHAAARVTEKTADAEATRKLLGSLAKGGDFSPEELAARYTQARELLAESPQAQRLLDNWHQAHQADRLRPAAGELFQARMPAGADLTPQAVHDRLYELMHGGAGADRVKVTDIQPPEAARIMLKDLEGVTHPDALAQRQILTRLCDWYDNNMRFRASFDGQLPPALAGGQTQRFVVNPGETAAAAKARYTEAVKKATGELSPQMQKSALEFAAQTPVDAYHMSVSTVGEGANQRTLLVAAQPSYGHENAVKMFVQSVGPEGASQRLHISVENGKLVDVKIETPGATPPRTWYWSNREPGKIHADLPNRQFGFEKQEDFLKYLESLPGRSAH
jgi:YD repeat-containing protein